MGRNVIRILYSELKYYFAFANITFVYVRPLSVYLYTNYNCFRQIYKLKTKIQYSHLAHIAHNRVDIYATSCVLLWFMRVHQETDRRLWTYEEPTHSRRHKKREKRREKQQVFKFSCFFFDLVCLHIHSVLWLVTRCSGEKRRKVFVAAIVYEKNKLKYEKEKISRRMFVLSSWCRWRLKGFKSPQNFYWDKQIANVKYGIYNIKKSLSFRSVGCVFLCTFAKTKRSAFFVSNRKIQLISLHSFYFC